MQNTPINIRVQKETNLYIIHIFRKNLRRQMKRTSLAIAVVCIFNPTVNATTPGGVTRRLCEPFTNTCIDCTTHVIDDKKDCLEYIKGDNSRRGKVKVCDSKTRVTICQEKLVQYRAPVQAVPVATNCSPSCTGPNCLPCTKDLPILTAQEAISAQNGKPTGVSVSVGERTGA